MGKFPWGEILAQMLPVVLAYFTGRYRDSYKKTQEKKDIL